MPGGNKNIKGTDGNTFSSTNQPANRGRKPAKFLTALLIKESNKKRDIIVEGIEMVNGQPTGKKVKVKIPMPTKEVIVQAHLRECAKGRMDAIKEYYDRVEGKAPQPIVGDKSMDPVSLEFVQLLMQTSGGDTTKSTE